MKYLLSLGAMATAFFTSVMGAAYTLSGTSAAAVETAFWDIAESFITNFVLILTYAIPLIIVFVIVKLIKWYMGQK